MCNFSFSLAPYLVSTFDPCFNLNNSDLGYLCCAKSLQLCPTLCDPMNHSLPGSCGHGIFQARNWSGSSFPTPGDLPSPGIEPASPVSPALAGGFFTTEPLRKPSSWLTG